MGRPAKNKEESPRRLIIQPPGADLPPGAEVIFQPASKPQEQALLTPAEEILTGGSKAGGKSVVGRAFILKGNPDADPKAHPANVSYVLHPEYRALALRRTYKEMLDWVNQAIMFFGNPKFPKEFRAVWKADPKYFEWPSGARCYVSHLKDSDSANLQKGWSVLHRVLIEELTESIEDSDEYFRILSSMRSLETTPELRCQLMATTNFDGPGLSWVTAHWLWNPNNGQKQPYGEMMEIPVTSPLSGKTRTFRRIFIPFKITDNPYISADYEFRLSMLPEHLRRVYLEGDPEGLNGSIFFPEFRTERKEGEPEGAVHLVKEEDLFWEEWEPTIASFDWGYSHKAVLLVGTIKATGPYQDRVIVREELVMRKLTDVEMGMRIANALYKYLNDKRKVIVVFVPPEIFAKWVEASQMESIVGRLKMGIDSVLGKNATKVIPGGEFMTQMKRQEGMRVILRPAENRRKHGWGVLRQMLDWSPLKMDRPSYDRNYALRLAAEKPELFYEYNQRMMNLEKEMGKVPKLLILEGKCPELVAGIRRAVFDQDGDVKKVDCDVNTGMGGDDALDACRYLAVGVHRIKTKEPEEVWLENELKVWSEYLQPVRPEDQIALREKLKRKAHSSPIQFRKRGVSLVGRA